jgi:hypothetical protein
MISLDAHTMVDYFIAISLFVLTIVFAHVPGARTLFLGGAIALTLYTLLSDLPFTAPKTLLPYATHLALDGVLAALLVFGPWLFGYRADMSTAETATHVGFGLTLFLSMAITNRHSALTWPDVREDVLRETDDRPAELAQK